MVGSLFQPLLSSHEGFPCKIKLRPLQEPI